MGKTKAPPTALSAACQTAAMVHWPLVLRNTHRMTIWNAALPTMPRLHGSIPVIMSGTCQTIRSPDGIAHCVMIAHERTGERGPARLFADAHHDQHDDERDHGSWP